MTTPPKARLFLALGALGMLLVALGHSIVQIGFVVWVGLLACGAALLTLFEATVQGQAKGSSPEGEPSQSEDAHTKDPDGAQAKPDQSADVVLSETPLESRYELLDKLGEGQMGEVWRARHSRLGRRCAVKSIRPDQLGDNQVKRFLREARVTSTLLSPHTVQVFDFGERPDGSLYYVMELLDGVDLQSLISRTGPMPVERVVHLLIQACHSLEEAHQAGLVHRDLKPANLVLCRYGLDVDFLKIVDFGLAKEDGAADATRLTSENTVLGTAAYLAPESLKGSALVDHRADIYALGCIAYWLLTGQMVFEFNVVGQMVRAHLLEPAPHVRERVPDAPEKLDRLISECLEKSPDNRPHSAAAVAAELGALELPTAWNDERARLFWNEHAHLHPDWG